ncbi:MAG TPA: hypothetical protein PKE12_05685 [Kiritimatiellia bacterium]|nr:hypothetical protein [Kiritimatiellia bacterium]
MAGLLTVALGVGFAYIVREYGNFYAHEERFRLILLVTAVIAGIFFISATARWWMRH